MRILLNDRFTYQNKQITLRHMFGSHEDIWAVHWDGWYEAKFRHVLSCLGFDVLSVQLINTGTLIPSLAVRAQKKHTMTLQNLEQESREILKESLVNYNKNELKKLDIWMNEFREVVKKMSL